LANRPINSHNLAAGFVFIGSVSFVCRGFIPTAMEMAVERLGMPSVFLIKPYDFRALKLKRRKGASALLCSIKPQFVLVVSSWVSCYG
jgi:hypothetical protein